MRLLLSGLMIILGTCAPKSWLGIRAGKSIEIASYVFLRARPHSGEREIPRAGVVAGCERFEFF